jgi:hypothetical protein
MSDRVVGYLVLVLSRVLSTSDTTLIFGKKILFPTWIDSVAHASSLAGRDLAPISLLRSGSQDDCARWQNVKIYELADGSAIYVQAVFAPSI